MKHEIWNKRKELTVTLDKTEKSVDQMEDGTELLVGTEKQRLLQCL